MDADVDVQMKDKDGNTARVLATQNGHTDIMQLLKTNPGEREGLRKQCEAATGEIHDAARSGDIEKVKALLNTQYLVEANAALVNAKGSSDWTPLMRAARKGHREIAKVLLAHGADVNAKDKEGFTPLNTAAEADHGNIVELLLLHNADANSLANDGRAPLHSAALQGYTNVARLLLANRARPDIQDAHGETPLLKAVSLGRRALAEMLLTHGAKANHKNADGRTPLHGAVGGRSTFVQAVGHHGISPT